MEDKIEDIKEIDYKKEKNNEKKMEKEIKEEHKNKKTKNNKELKKTNKIKRKKTYRGFYMWMVLLFVIVTGLVYYNYDFLFGEKEIAARVNNEVITMAELEAQYENIPEIYKYLMPKESLLNRIIDFVVIRQNAENSKIKVTDKEIDSIIKYLSYYLTEEEFEKEIENYGTLRNFRNDLKETKLVQKYVSENVLEFMHTEEELRELFEQYEEVLSKEYLRAKQILICHSESINCDSNKTKEEAFEFINNMKKEISKNNFEEFAKEFSQDISASQGGDLGWITRGQTTADFEDIVFSLEEGKVSEVVETELGYHLILIISKREPIEVDFEEIKPFIEFRVFNQIQQEANHAFLNFAQELREEADIEIFLEIDKKSDLVIEDIQIVDKEIKEEEIFTDDISEQIEIIIDDEELIKDYIQEKKTEKCFEINEKIILYYQEESQRSLEMKEITEEYENILYVKRTENINFIEDCIEDFKRTIVPQIICTNNNEVILGSISKEEFDNFYNNC